MRMSRYLLPTTRENPSDAETVSHRLMTRAGLIRKVAAGIYTYLPLGLRVIKKVEEIIREEMNRAGAIELLMPFVLPAELWRESGRWDLYGKELLRLKDRGERDFCLGPTHEEIITDLARKEVRSYRQLPLNLYQIQTKFRDEMRPRFGLMRGREFIMKDAYSFDLDDEGADKSYGAMYEAYSRIFSRMGLKFKAVEADTGTIGGSSSHEFMVIADSGEDEIISCGKCEFGSNVELAEVAKDEGVSPSGVGKKMEKVHTPGKRTIEEVTAFLGLRPKDMIKTLVFSTDKGEVAVVAAGNRTINEVKVKNFLGAEWIELSDEKTVKEITGAATGFAGPISLPCRVLADRSIQSIAGGATGANEDDYHIINVVPERDFTPYAYGDFRMIEVGDGCPRCGGKVSFSKGIEVGHIFKLGTKYSHVMKSMYLDRDGREKLMVMGCYGIGVGRTASAAIEQNHDDDGIIFPISIAPYESHIVPVNAKDGKTRETAESMYNGLVDRGVEVLIDDREERPGIKFKDADLIGIPFRITIGEKKAALGKVEVRERKSGKSEDVPIAEAVGMISEKIERDYESCLVR